VQPSKDGWINLCVYMCATTGHTEPNRSTTHQAIIHPFPVQANKAREMTNRLHSHTHTPARNQEIKPVPKLRSEAAGEEMAQTRNRYRREGERLGKGK
jgi:hypothetical protein